MRRVSLSLALVVLMAAVALGTVETDMEDKPKPRKLVKPVILGPNRPWIKPKMIIRDAQGNVISGVARPFASQPERRPFMLPRKTISRKALERSGAPTCTDNNGNAGECMDTAACKGTSTPHKCPGAANIQCCVVASAPPVNPPVTPPAPSSGGITLAQFKACLPGIQSSVATQALDPMNAAMAEFGINTCLRRSAWFGQVGEESASLRYMQEIASGAAYNGRRDLGNTQPGDGPRFKGRGPLQLTGRANYQKVGQALGLDLINNPTSVATYPVGFRTSGYFWKTHGLNELADARNFAEITHRVNGCNVAVNACPATHYSTRQMYYNACKKALGC